MGQGLFKGEVTLSHSFEPVDTFIAQFLSADLGEC